MQLNVLTIVGVGLIGGSIGLAAKKNGLARRVRGLGRNQESLEKAVAAGAIDEGHLDAKPAFAGAEFAVFCTPVDQIVRQVLDYSRWCPSGTVITDVGSTKETIVEQIESQLPLSLHFVGSHPLAGSEKRGPEFADANLFQDRWTVLTPTARTDAQALGKVRDFWASLGSRVSTMSPHEHDQALGLTSHLPHLLASALAGILPPTLHDLTATGFRDTTRVAAGDPSLWTAIFSHNRLALLKSLALLEERLSDFRRALESHDWTTIDNLLAQAKKVRDALGS